MYEEDREYVSTAFLENKDKEVWSGVLDEESTWAAEIVDEPDDAPDYTSTDEWGEADWAFYAGTLEGKLGVIRGKIEKGLTEDEDPATILLSVLDSLNR